MRGDLNCEAARWVRCCFFLSTGGGLGAVELDEEGAGELERGELVRGGLELGGMASSTSTFGFIAGGRKGLASFLD